MEILAHLIAILIISITLYDVFITVLSHQGAGPITTFWTKATWNFFLKTKYRWNTSYFVSNAGPFYIVGIIAVWYILLNLSWFIIISNGDFAIKGKSDATMGSLDVLYFIGSTFSTLGIGDYIPNGFPWTFVTTLGALILTFITSFAVSYAIPVLNAVVTRRKLVDQLKMLGCDRKKILERCWTFPEAGQLDSEVLEAAKGMISESYKAKLYPILGYFYFPDTGQSLNLSILNLLDATIYQKYHSDREGNLSKPKLSFVLQAIESYVANLWDDCDKKAMTFKARHEDLYEFIGVENSTKLKSNFECDILDIRKKLLVFAFYEGYCDPSGSKVLDLSKAS